MAGAIWRSNLLHKLTTYLPEDSKVTAQSIFQSIVVAQKFAIGTAERVAIDQAYRETQRLLAIAATCALAPMIIFMWFIKNVDLVPNKEEGENGVEEEEGSETRRQAETISSGVDKA